MGINQQGRLCQTCRYFLRLWWESQKHKEPQPVHGLCKRHAPSSAVGGQERHGAPLKLDPDAIGYWPSVNGEAWCGEWDGGLTPYQVDDYWELRKVQNEYWALQCRIAREAAKIARRDKKIRGLQKELRAAKKAGKKP